MLQFLLGMLGGSTAQNLAQRTGLNAASAGSLKSLMLGKSDATANAVPINPRFKTHYEQFIRPQIESFERERITALAKLKSRMLVFLPVAAIALVCGLIGSRVPEGQFSVFKGLGILGMFAAFAAGAWAAIPVLNYKGDIKSRIFGEVFRFFGPQWNYEPKGLGNSLDMTALAAGGVKQAYAELKRAGNEQAKRGGIRWGASADGGGMQPYMAFSILPAHDTSHTEDRVHGSYKDVPITLFECRLSSESGSGKNRRTVTEFDGLVITLDVPKRFTGHTIVKRDSGKIGNWFGKQFKGGLKPVKLEDPRFETRYEVYGTDQVDARYLLNPAFMERLVALEDLFAAQNKGRCNIQCAFRDGKLLFAVPSDKDWFATGSIFTPANFTHEINTVLDEMEQLFAIIDVLKLDDKTRL